MQIPQEVTEQFIALVSALVFALLTWVGSAIHSKVKSDAVRSRMLRLSEAVENAVRAVGHELSNEVREAGADGKITTEEASALRKKALEYVKLYLGEHGTKELEQIVGINELGELVYTMIESQLHKLKASAPVLLTAELPPEGT